MDRVRISGFLYRLALALAALALPAAAAATAAHPGTLLPGTAVIVPSNPVEPGTEDLTSGTSRAAPDTDQNAMATASGAVPGVSAPCLDAPGADHFDGSPGRDLCAKPVLRRQRLSLELGRQVRARSGVLGQVAGLLVDYRLGSGVTLNGVAGYLPASDQEQINLDKQLFGLSLDTRRLAGNWDLNAYFIEEQQLGHTGDRALGSVLRHLRPRRSLLMALDYDANDGALSTFMVSGAWKLLRHTTFSTTLDLSRSGGLGSREQGFLQEALSSTDGWGWALPMDRIRSLSRQDSTEVGSVGLGVSHAFSRRIKLDGDFAVLDVARDTATGGVHRKEYFYHLKLSGKDLVLAGNRSALALRHNVTGSARTASAIVDSSYALNSMWQLKPRLRTDYQDDAARNAARWSASPAVKMQYRWREMYDVELEAGGEWSRSRPHGDHESAASYFLTLGYRASF